MKVRRSLLDKQWECKVLRNPAELCPSPAKLCQAGRAWQSPQDSCRTPAGLLPVLQEWGGGLESTAFHYYILDFFISIFH